MLASFVITQVPDGGRVFVCMAACLSGWVFTSVYLTPYVCPAVTNVHWVPRAPLPVGLASWGPAPSLAPRLPPSSCI